MTSDGNEKEELGQTTRDRATRWGCTERTIQRWVRDGCPIDDDIQTVKWLDQKKGLSDEVMRRCRQVKASNPEAFPMVDPDWTRYQAVRATRRNLGGKLPFESLESIRDFFAYKLELASESGDLKGVTYAVDRLVDIDRAIRDHKLAEKKLGIEIGETITRPIAERWIRAWVFWTMRGVDLSLDTLCKRLAESIPGSTSEQIRGILEPWMLENRMVIPFARSAKLAAGIAAPAWAIDCAKDAVDDYIENGVAEFEAHL